MTIEQLVDLAKRIHDAEKYDLGASSTREARNAFWMRVLGCAHFGHSVYNPTADPQWCVKDAGGGRPMSDDTAVSMPSRQAWDCIPGAGSSGYRFAPDALGVLPPEQHVYVPDRPSTDAPASEAMPPYPGDAAFDSIGTTLWADYAEANRIPDAQVGRWFGRTVYDHLTGLTLDASIVKHRAEWRNALGLGA